MRSAVAICCFSEKGLFRLFGAISSSNKTRTPCRQSANSLRNIYWVVCQNQLLYLEQRMRFPCPRCISKQRDDNDDRIGGGKALIDCIKVGVDVVD